MLSIRIVTAGAVLVMAVSGAAAQTATDTTPGKPIALLQGLGQPNKAPKTKTHAKIAKKSTARTHHIPAAARAAHAPAPHSDVWPALQPAAPATVAAAEPPPQSAPANGDPAPSELTVGGQTVQVASPDDVNAIDLAADEHNDAATAAPKTSAPNNSAPKSVAPKTDSLPDAPAVQAMVATPVKDDPSPVGSASWIAQVLAALGGAVAAGSIAWFLIGSTPQRTFG